MNSIIQENSFHFLVLVGVTLLIVVLYSIMQSTDDLERKLLNKYYELREECDKENKNE